MRNTLASIVVAVALVVPHAAIAKTQHGSRGAGRGRAGVHAPAGARAPAPAPSPAAAPAPAPPAGSGQAVAAPSTFAATGPLRHPVAPAPPPYYGVYTPYYRVGTVFYGGYFLYPWDAPLWWGWGWGYGYYPLYPRPVYATPSDHAIRTTTELRVTGAASRHDYAGGVALAIDGERLGFQVAVDAFAIGNSRYTASFDTTGALGRGSLHLTYALLSSDVYRLRLELGGSLTSWPDTSTFAGATSLGPEVGVSGHLGLAGPLGFEGHARVTPFPVAVLDVRAALAARLGPLAVTGGWRELATGSRNDGASPSLTFSGPELGVSLLF